MEFHHIPVLLSECLDGLNIKACGTYVDGTAGGAGHSREIAKRLNPQMGGRLFSFDRDPDAVQTATKRLAEFSCAQVVHANFDCMIQALKDFDVTQVDGILLDLGVSSHQLDTPERGFSYQTDAPLDMRMSQQGITAADIVNTFDVQQLTRILREYGEEKFAYQIAKNIVAKRQTCPIETTGQLTQIIKTSMPAAARRDKNPAKRSFQAIRIAVNAELDSLSAGLDAAFSLLAPGGRLTVITFHSLEDRIVKQRFKTFCQGCTCPPDFPVCVCGNTPKAKLVYKKPIVANTAELAVNKRSQSAKLRVLEKL